MASGGPGPADFGARADGSATATPAFAEVSGRDIASSPARGRLVRLYGGAAV